MAAPFSFTPIGVVHSPFTDKVSAPRQGVAAEGVTGTIELYPGHDFEHALEDLEGWDRIWVLFVFHLNDGGWKPKVLPPRSETKRGVFATRSPHRPNPIGLSVVRLESVSGLTVAIRDLDLIDGTPVLDLKPYVPYADAFPTSRTGWLEAPSAEGRGERPKDPAPGYAVGWTERAAEQAAFVAASGFDLRAAVDQALALGPQPHPYRRIKREGDGLRLAVKDWRVRFRVEGRAVTVREVVTGYRKKDLEGAAAPEVGIHRDFVARFGGGGGA